MKQLFLLITFYFGQSLLCSGGAMADNVRASVGPDYHYEGFVEFKPEKGFLAANWHINVLSKNNNDMVFLLRNTLANVKVSGPALEKFTLLEKPDMPGFWAISLSLNPAVEDRSLNISYDGELLPEPLENKINSINADSIELTVDSFWHPIDASFTKLFTLALDIHIDSDWAGVSNAQITKIESGIRLVNSKPGLDIPFALSNRFAITKKSGFSLYDLRDSTKGQEALVETAAFCKDYLNKRFGRVEVLPASKFLITDRSSSGYSRQSYIAFTDVSETQPVPLTKFVCHELAHFWSSGGKFDTVENWLNEAFAEYAGAMAVRERFGRQAYDELLASFEKQIENKSLGPIWRPGDTERRSYLVQYRKGPLVLAQLDKHIGPEAFQKLVTEYMVRRVSTTPELLILLQEIAGVEAKNWFMVRLAS